MNKRRINTIIADLRFVAGKSGRRTIAKLNGVTVDFYMGDWCGNPEAAKRHPCRTTACAIGTHCLMHPRATLKIDQGMGRPIFNGEVSEGAIADYLAIPDHDAEALFLPSSVEHVSASPAQMARVLEVYRDTGDAEKALEVLT